MRAQPFSKLCIFDAVVIRELKAMLTSDGVRKLLARAPDNLFAQVIRRADAVIAEGASDRDTVNRLWQFMDDDDFCSFTPSARHQPEGRFR